MKKKEVVDLEVMFIRFVGAEIDERSHVAAGLFWAASQLRWSESLPDYEFDALTELRDWFNVHKDSPFDHLSRGRRYEQAICWFKPTAREHLELGTAEWTEIARRAPWQMTRMDLNTLHVMACLMSQTWPS